MVRKMVSTVNITISISFYNICIISVPTFMLVSKNEQYFCYDPALCTYIGKEFTESCGEAFGLKRLGTAGLGDMPKVFQGRNHWSDWSSMYRIII